MASTAAAAGHLPAARLVAESVTLAPATSRETIDATTEMLLKVRNMSDKEIGTTYRDVRVEEQVKQYCKSKLFHWLKFIVNRTDLGRLTNDHDIGNVVMNKLNVNEKAYRPRWWLLYKDVVRKAIDTQRSNCNMAIKSVMIGKYKDQTAVCACQTCFV